MSVKAEFDSDTNFANFVDAIGWRYPGNLMDIDDGELTVVFKGDPPDPLVRDLIKDNGGVCDDY